MRPNHTKTGLALWSSLTLETRSHPRVLAGHPQYTGAWFAREAVDGPKPPQPIRKPLRTLTVPQLFCSTFVQHVSQVLAHSTVRESVEERAALHAARRRWLAEFTTDGSQIERAVAIMRYTRQSPSSHSERLLSFFLHHFPRARKTLSTVISTFLTLQEARMPPLGRYS